MNRTALFGTVNVPVETSINDIVTNCMYYYKLAMLPAYAVRILKNEAQNQNINGINKNVQWKTRYTGKTSLFKIYFLPKEYFLLFKAETINVNEALFSWVRLNAPGRIGNCIRLYT